MNSKADKSTNRCTLRCFLCGRIYKEEKAHKNNYCSMECYEMDSLIADDDRTRKDEIRNMLTNKARQYKDDNYG